MRSRRADRVSLWILGGVLAQLAAGTIYVSVRASQDPDAYARRQAERAIRDTQHQADVLDSVANRMAKFEEMDIGVRLGHLEDSAKRIEKVEYLVYGMIVTLIGHLLATIIQIREQREHRR